MANPIVVENQNAGSSGWRPTSGVNGVNFSTQIQAYADQLSLDPGSTITFFVSVQVAATTYTLNIYRLGSYRLNGGSLKNTQSGLVGVAQGWWDETNQVLNSCPTAVIDSTTHRIEAGWAAQCSWSVPVGACTGVYIAVFTDANNQVCSCSFVVRGNNTADYVVVRSELTEAAYNTWGGYSLYQGLNVGNNAATKVSFNRPQVQGCGARGLMLHEMAGIKWLENQGYNLSYLSMIDAQTNPSQLQNYKAVIFLGHSEYWTKEIRDGVEASIAVGTGLAIMGANTCYWQVRMENSSTGTANRTVTCYKVQSNGQTNFGPRTSLSPLSNDPFFGVDNTRVTSVWRDPLLNRPEVTFIGIQYVFGNYYTQFQQSNVAWIVDSGAGSNALLTTTGLVAGSSYGIDGVGYEWDGGTAVGSPSNLQIIATTATTGQVGASTSNTAVYIASSGAMVFASGAINWVSMLDSYRWFTPNQAGNRVAPQVQNFMANVMARLITGKNTKTFSMFAVHQ